MKKRIVLCADDYGQGQEISTAILLLLQQGRLSATSCLVGGPLWVEHAGWLKDARVSADIGLHFNLTEGSALSSAYRRYYGAIFNPLPIVLRQAFLGRFALEPLMAEFDAQLDRFIAAMGREPDFIDGHQHVHQFPAVRDAILAVYQQRGLGSRIRLVNPGLFSGPNPLKKIMICLTGSYGLGKRLRTARIPYNASFAGIYDFADSKRYKMYFPRFLGQLSDGGLLMCHPALPGAQDAIGEARAREYHYLISDAFRADCERHRALLARWTAL